MVEKAKRAVAVVGVGAVLPDAPNADAYWENLKSGRYSITEVDPATHWDPALYYDPDPKAPDKTYSIIGGWVHDWDWSPLEWRLPIPPKVSDAMDRTQKWSVIASREALIDYGYPDRPLDADRTAVVLGNAMAGDKHYLTALRAYFPEYADELTQAPSFAALPGDVQGAVIDELRTGIRARFPDITEDTMPGELGNIIAGRVANLYNLHGPNFVVDAACASALAAIDAAVEGLEQGDYDAVLTGGIDANMGVPSFIKFCKIGALSATGTRPYHDGADGFVMGEGAAVMLLKRLEDAERDGDHIYAVIRGIGGSSDGKGKGITAPNPIGQEFAISRAWRNAGLVPDAATLIEGHGTSTRVGDVVEAESLGRVFADLGLKAGSIPLGSVKSNIGHLKSSAGAAGMLKAAMALDTKLIPPSLGGTEPNPNIDFANSPLFINKELREWKTEAGQVRSAGVSAFGFGGTNFHIVLEEYIPGRLQVDGVKSSYSVASPQPTTQVRDTELKTPLRGALVIGDNDEAAVVARLRTVVEQAASGAAPDPAPPAEADLRAPFRVAIDYGDAAELAKKGEKALKAFETGNPGMWKALGNQGVFRGEGQAQMVAFLYTGQGSQYANMLHTLRQNEPVVRDVIAEADGIMEPILGKPLSDYIYADPDDSDAVMQAEMQLRQTEITQPAVLTIDNALTALLASYGIHPDMVMGHSLGEYGALVASGAMPFADALEAAAGRGREMASIEVEDPGLMAAVFAPLDDVIAVTEQVDDYVVVANHNSTRQAVIGGSTAGVEEAGRQLTGAGAQVIPLPVSHAFHTEIVAEASDPLRVLLQRLRLESPAIPLVANTDGEFYPMGPNVVPKMIDILGKQIASPVQFVKGLNTLYAAGCRVFIEVGPKKALQGLAEDVLGEDPTVITLFSNHPKAGDVVTFNQAMCGLYAAGHGVGTRPEAAAPTAEPERRSPMTSLETKRDPKASAAAPPATTAVPAPPAPTAAAGDMYSELGHLFADFLAKGQQIFSGQPSTAPAEPRPASFSYDRPVVVTGAGVGLPGGAKVFGDDKVPALLAGEQFIGSIPPNERQKITNKKVTRLVKSEAGGGHFEVIDDPADVIKLAGRGGEIDLVGEFGFPAERAEALDRTSALAIGAGIDALRDAGIPLAMHYKDTTTGTKLQERWLLPEAYRDTTGVIFASAFPGADGMMDEVDKFHETEMLEARRNDLLDLQSRLEEFGGSADLANELQRRIADLDAEIERADYHFNRKFLYQAVSFGHAQFAEYIGARGPNTQINAACASTTQAVAIAEDWIRAERCDRVVIISGDDVTNDLLLEWIGTGFLAMGAAATDESVETAALPFDRRRHGLILGMGAAAIVVERPESAAERGILPIAEVLSAVTANSAFHGSRLDSTHIRHVMEDLISTAERRWGVDRNAIASSTVFVSHETYTPARGGSAQAEIDALRYVFGAAADQIVVSNTKGYTGHAMGVGVEDVLAIKAMETGLVPPVPNFKEPDPDLGILNLSRGGAYPIEYALRLGAGFGSQISLTLYRYVPTGAAARPAPAGLGYETRLVDPTAWQRWLESVTGNPAATVEIDKRTLRVRDDGPPSVQPAAATSFVAPVAASAGAGYQVPGTPAAPTAPPAPAAVATAATPSPAPPPVAAPSEPSAGLSSAQTATPEAAAGDPVADRVLEIVAAQTGYPPDMLDLDLDLEADLGVDTVKQAETFAAIQEEYSIERDDTLALRDYPTLNHVIGFVRDKRPDLAAPSEPSAGLSSAQTATPEAAAGDPVADRVLEIVAAQTGYPPDMLDLDLDLEADLGVDTVKQAETFAAIQEEYSIERDDTLALRDYPTLNHVIGFVRDKRPDLAAPSEPSAGLSSAQTATPEAAAGDPVADRVLEIVAAQTGYPPDMLDLDLDLEADLGVDTVKQAETFAAIQEEYSIERDDTLALRDYPTLNHVIGFVRDKRPDLAAPSEPSAGLSSAQTATPEAAAGDPVADRVLEIVAAQTGYPPDMLDLDLDLEADLGVDTVKQAETFAAIQEEYSIERDDNLALRDYPTLNHVIAFVYDRAPDLAGAQVPGTTTQPVGGPAPVPAANAETGDAVEAQVLAIVSEQTGYPTDMLDLNADLEADLGVDTVKQAETFAAIRDQYGIERDDNLALRDYPTLNHVIAFVYDRAPDLAGAQVPGTTTQPVGGPAPVPAANAETGDAVEAQVLAIVSEQTGYPTDMLDLNADLEADLGVDTVKQAETFAAIRDQYGIERDDNLALRDYPTLNHVIAFVYDRAPDLAGAQVPGTTEMPVDAPTAQADLMVGDDVAAAGIPRRIPTAVLRPDLDLCAPTGVRIDDTSRIVVMMDHGGIGKKLIKRLEKLGSAVLAIEDAPDADELKSRLDAFAADGAIQGVYWLPALDPEAAIADMDLAAWREALRIRVKLLFETMRHLYESIGESGTFLVSATRLGGRHGYDAAGAVAPMGGAVSGFTKAFKREKPEALVKAVDFESGRKTATPADALVAETLRDPGAVEIGLTDDRRWTVSVLTEDLPGEPAGLSLDADSVFVVTGAAGSIVSAITADLARAGGGVFHLLDLIPEPDRDDADIAAFAADKDGLKRTIFERLKASGERATPAKVERQIAGIERSHAALAAIQAIETAGGTVHYHSVNLLDGDAVGDAMAKVRDVSGKVDVLLHAGGLEISRLLPDKERSEYDLVFDVKADGWFNLLRGLGDTPIGSTVGFSSVAGRFGNNGQTDYSAANDLLCKYASSFRTSRPDTLGIAIDWTAWGDIGMATRGSIPTVMKAVGIDMLPAAAGIPIVRRELTGRAVGGEVVIGQRLGLLLDEFEPTGGLDVSDEGKLGGLLGDDAVIQAVSTFGIYSGLVATGELDPTVQPFLYDHQIDGTAVLPGVMGVETFAEVAKVAFPDLAVAAVEDVNFMAPFKFYRDEPRTIEVAATFTVDGVDVIADCELVGTRTLANQPEPQRTVHFTGRVRLSPEVASLGATDVPEVTGTVADAAAIYRIFFHGPTYQVLDQAGRADEIALGRFAEDLPPNHLPETLRTTTWPRLAELAFQTSGVLEIGRDGTMALPMHIDRVAYAGNPAKAKGRIHAVVTQRDGGFDVRVADEKGTTFVDMRGYQTVQLPTPLDEDAVAPLHDAMTS